MEPIGALPDGEWEPFSRMFNGEEVQFMPQFLGQFSFPAEDDEGLNSLSLSSFFPTPDEANMSVNDPVFYSLNALTSNFHSVSQASSYSSICSDGIFVPNPSHEPSCFSGHNQIPVTNDISMCMDNSMGIAGVDEQKTSNSFVSVFPDIIMEETAYPNEDSSNDRLGSMVDCRFTANSVPAKELQLKRKFNVAELCARGGNDINPSESVMKKLRVLNAEKTNKRNAQLKKNQKITPNGNNEDSNAASEGQSCSSYSSEDDNASQETNGAASFRSKTPAAVNMNGKTRASRGTATDPQSLYARKRRERINERLRILQNLVPNGTKVDISTMLEEAVHYVKFLQLQIKLLSSDDLWMYAPLAYNGLDLGLHHKISPLL